MGSIGGNSQTWCRLGSLESWCSWPPHLPAAFGIASRDGGALLAGDKFSEAPFVAILSALLAILSRQRLSLGFGVRMFGAGRQRRISRGEFLNLVGERSDLLLELVDTFLITSHQSFDEITCRLGFRR